MIYQDKKFPIQTESRFTSYIFNVKHVIVDADGDEHSIAYVVSKKLSLSLESQLTPERKLWLAVYEQALSDAFSCSSDIAKQEQRSALAFIYGKGAEGVLSVIGIDNEYAMLVLKKVISESVPSKKEFFRHALRIAFPFAESLEKEKKDEFKHILRVVFPFLNKKRK